MHGVRPRTVLPLRHPRDEIVEEELADVVLGARAGGASSRGRPYPGARKS